MALSKPIHFVLFGLALVAMGATAFNVTQELVHPDEVVYVEEEATEGAAQPAPGLIIEVRQSEPAEATPVSEPTEFPDLAIHTLAARECLTTNAAPGGTLSLTLRNQGRERTGGFRLYVEVLVQNVQSGEASRSVRDFWEHNVAVGQERQYQVPYAFPVRQVDPIGTIALNEPVPGPYKITVTIDRPSELAFLGPEGIIKESDEENNLAQLETSGIASGVC